VLSLLAFLLSRFVSDVAGRTLLATVLFAAAGAYFGLAFEEGRYEIWVPIELLQSIVFGTLGLYGWRGSAKWLALGYALHPFWDFPLHYLGPGRSYAPATYAIFCISFDWIAAAYILIYYRGSNRLTQSPQR
jgi:hypothetical protein